MFMIQSSDLSHIFGCYLKQNQKWLIMSGKGQHQLEFSHDITRIHSLMMYSDIKEYNIVGDTKYPLLK